MKKELRKPLRRVGGLLLLLAPGYIMLRAFEYGQVYHPDRVFTATGSELGRVFEDVAFSSADGMQLNGWFFPADKDSSRAHTVILLCHGNAGNISHRLDTCSALLETGASVFLFDYRGYGRSQGRPSEEGTYRDAQAAYHWLRRKGFDGERIVAFGESLGGGVAAELAVRERVAGLVLQSTFTSIPDIGSELFPWLPVRWLSTIKYDTKTKLPRLNWPVLVMHSRGDSLIAFHHAQDNYAAANSPKAFCEIQGDHNNSLEDRAAFIAGVEGLLRMVQSRAESNPAANPADDRQ